MTYVAIDVRVPLPQSDRVDADRALLAPCLSCSRRFRREHQPAFAVLEQTRELITAHRLTVQIALRLIATHLPQRLELLARFDAFGDYA